MAVGLGLLAVVSRVGRTPPPPPRPRIAARAELRATAPDAMQRASPCPDIARPPTGGRRVKAVYPPEARQLQTAASVRLKALIGKDGKVRKLEVVSGHPLLAAAAVEAAKHWVYRPVCVNGEPVDVVTVIDVLVNPRGRP